MRSAAPTSAKQGSTRTYRGRAKKTLGFELFEEMRVPDLVVVPTGTGGLITSIFKAFKQP
jgi:threonine synthase